MNASDGNNNNPHENNRSRFNDNQRKGKGRQKLNMEKIENETNLQVTFSKRRAGLFKKASELSTLCSAESAIVVFSPGDKAHSFGHPNVETIASRFLNTHLAPPDTNPLLAAHNEATMKQRNQELISLEAQLEAERQRKRELESLLPPNISELNYDQLAQLQASLLDFKKSFEAKVKSASSSGGCGAGSCVGFVNDPSVMQSDYNNPNVGVPSNPWGYDPNLANLGYTVQYPDQFVGGIGAGGSYMNYPMNPYNYGNPSDEVSSDDEDDTQD